MPPTTRLICRPWAGVNDLPADKPDLTPDAWDGLLWQASEMLYRYSGSQYSGGGCQSTIVVDAPAQTGRARPGRLATRPDPADAAAYARGTAGRVGLRSSVVALPDPPVTSVDEVLLDGLLLHETSGYTADLPAGLLRRPGGWPLDGSVEITYTNGLPPPIGGHLAAVALAVELGRARAGSKCNLPRRIESVQRLGVTVNMLNTFEHLQDWRTGLFEVDAWLAEENPHKIVRRAAVVSPDVPRTRRVVR